MPSRTLVFGDIHGCLAPFDALLEATAPTKEDHIVLLGDIVDRGPASNEVIERVISMHQSHRVTVVMGNHEQMMLDARHSMTNFADWLRNGGDATLRSYAGARAMLRDVPAEHWDFLECRLVSYLETDTHLFVHASVYPDMPMFQQPEYMLRWERCDDISPHESGKTIVCGHTPQRSGKPLNKRFAICLDTNACRGGMLTCLDANSGNVWQADPRGKVTRSYVTDYE